jgi:hypothetical protein
LVAVLLTLVAIAAVRGHTVAGVPAATPVQGAPQVGDCVTKNPYDLGADLYDLPAIRTGPCTGPRFGDVAFIVDDYVIPPADATAGPDPCSEHVDDYLGTPLPPPPDGSFVPVAGVPWTLIGPDARQRAAAQNWAACMIFLPISIDATTPLTVDHSLQGAWQRTQDSRLFAVCVDEIATLWAVNCRWPHRFEQLGVSWGTPGVTQQSLEAACRQVVVQALGSPAALDRGELTSRVVAARPNPNIGGNLITGPDAITPDSEYRNNCLATPAGGDRRLTAPLRGLGDAAVPMN